MANTEGYYRFPTIHGDRVVFVCEDDLWYVSAEGGRARRLTANPGVLSRPAFSPDGRHLAYVGRDEGHDEAWVMDSEGGKPRRLTWFGSLTHVVGWSRSSRSVIVATDAAQPFVAYYHLHSVPVSGGPSTPLPFGPALSIAHEAEGPGVVLGRFTGDPARWKRYRGGTAGTLWVDREGRGNFAKLLELPGNVAGPMWIGKRIWFLSDHEGFGNLYSCRPDGGEVRRHTDQDDFYVRFPRSDGERIVYAAGADIRLHDPRSGEDRRIEIDYRSARPQRNRRFVDAARYLETFDLHPEGHSLAVCARGRPFTFALWEGAVSQHGKPDGARYRLPRWLPGGEKLVAISDEAGEEDLVVLAPGRAPRRVKVSEEIGRAVSLSVSPTSPHRVAITNHRYELVLIDLAKKKARVVDRSRHKGISGVAWSPDGRWLAYCLPASFLTTGVMLHDVEGGRNHRVTRSDFRDFGPAFDPEGKYLYFLSYREFDPVYDSHSFDLGFPRGCRVMAVPLTRDLPSPFEPLPRTPAPGGPAAKKGKGENGGPPARVKIDCKGIEDRVLSFPVPEGNYGEVKGIRGKVLFTSFPVEGSLGADWSAPEPAANGKLESFDMKELKQETLLAGMSDFEVSLDSRVVAVRAGRRIRVLPAGVKPDEKSSEKPAGRESGWIDLGRLRISVEPGEEWRQMFREAWRLQRDHFWTPDMSGTDWSRVLRRYLPLVDRVSSRSDFSDLMWEMQGELGTSHAYELAGDYRPTPAYHQGFLGADLRYDPKSKAWKVRRIPRGDTWDRKGVSPLAAPGLGIRPGTRILAIGHQKLDARNGPGTGLVHRAGERVALTVADPDGRRKRTVTVTTLPQERSLRYRDWVESNRRTVHEESGGRVGYVHVPNMGPQGFAEFQRYFLAEVSRDSLIIDVRFNGGGHVSQILLEKLIQKRVGFDTQRWGEAVPYPSQSVAGPLVALTNERAGSDGDIFSHCFKLYGLGPLIGKRTWGGVVGIWPRHALVDGTVTTQPEFSFWFKDVGFGVENYGTDPDIEVEILPQDHRRGKDPQLATGIAEALRLLAENPPMKPDFSKRPDRSPPKLPKR